VGKILIVLPLLFSLGVSKQRNIGLDSLLLLMRARAEDGQPRKGGGWVFKERTCLRKLSRTDEANPVGTQSCMY